MADRSVFTDDEWKAVTEAPLRMTLALVTVGKHSPLSVVKEAAASARAIAHDLIAAIAREAESRESRHDVKAHLGQSPEEIVDRALADLAPAAQALEKLSTDEAAAVRAWLVSIANAVVATAKTPTSDEQDVIAKIAGVFGASAA